MRLIVDLENARSFRLITNASDLEVYVDGTLDNGSDFFAGGRNDAIRVSGTTGNSSKGAGDGTAIETVAFYNNGEVIIDTTLIDGDDVIDINSASNDHDNVDLTIATGSGNDKEFGRFSRGRTHEAAHSFVGIKVWRPFSNVSSTGSCASSHRG